MGSNATSLAVRLASTAVGQDSWSDDGSGSSTAPRAEVAPGGETPGPTGTDGGTKATDEYLSFPFNRHGTEVAGTIGFTYDLKKLHAPRVTVPTQPPIPIVPPSPPIPPAATPAVTSAVTKGSGLFGKIKNGWDAFRTTVQSVASNIANRIPTLKNIGEKISQIRSLPSLGEKLRTIGSGLATVLKPLSFLGKAAGFVFKRVLPILGGAFALGKLARDTYNAFTGNGSWTKAIFRGVCLAAGVALAVALLPTGVGTVAVIAAIGAGLSTGDLVADAGCWAAGKISAPDPIDGAKKFLKTGFAT